MEFNRYIEIPIIIAISLFAITLFISQHQINNADINTYVGKAQEMRTKAEAIQTNIQNQTQGSNIWKYFEDVPVFGLMFKAGRYLGALLDVVMSALDTFTWLIRDSLNSAVLGVPTEIVVLVVALLFIGFGFAVYRALRGG